MGTVSSGSNPNDAIRQQMLRYFYDRNASATSKYGKKGSSVKISDVKKDLKNKHGLAQQQVVSNLTYLIDMGWVKESEIQKQVSTKGGTVVPSTVTWYEVSAAGIDKIEGESEFTSSGRFSGINIQATGSNVIAMGDGNVVNVAFEDLHNQLTSLAGALTSSADLSEDQKLEVVADIESLKDQLAKPIPNPTVVKALWDGVDKAAAIAGLAQLGMAIYPHIQHLLS